MNEFINLRNSIGDYKESYYFMEILLEKFLSKELSIEEQSFLDDFNEIKHIETKANFLETDLHTLFSMLGNNSYTDRYIVDTIFRKQKMLSRKSITRIIEKLLQKKIYVT